MNGITLSTEGDLDCKNKPTSPWSKEKGNLKSEGMGNLNSKWKDRNLDSETELLTEAVNFVMTLNVCCHVDYQTLNWRTKRPSFNCETASEGGFIKFKWVTCRAAGHGSGGWSFEGWRKITISWVQHVLVGRAPPRAGQSWGQWKSHQGCKSRTMEVFALHCQWMIVWPSGHTDAWVHWAHWGHLLSGTHGVGHSCTVHWTLEIRSYHYLSKYISLKMQFISQTNP